ncbi:diacylglycerol kinase family protein [Pokkaliibacter sp. MBI-7]|uniref:diacylglycerol/lipid kinase family protein n=1 Tax=Pokkaliibacter sp. MBI-7 TaxID=3040600 RepID=UPI00244999A0|nr:diacylglycerol kinase family protein [Pokkaliibacter sp. MBI-7]MDH2435799.1 diacylglycerol kinase family protein [Pokkaliibacter sp. MBI-7]
MSLSQPEVSRHNRSQSVVSSSYSDEQLSKAPVHLVANGKSGRGARDVLVAIARRLCERDQRPLRLHLPEHPRFLPDKAREALDAAREEGGVIVAAGGDGTIRSVVQEISGAGIPLGVIPIGTFNFFARNHAIPEDFEQAFETVLSGRLKAIDIGDINGQAFVINSSFGLYSRLIRARERHTSRWGRNRWVATISTLLTLLRGSPSLDLEMGTAERRKRLRTPMVFVGINALQLHDVSLDVAHCALDHKLAVVVMRPPSKWGLLRLSLHGLMRRLRDDDNLEGFCAGQMVIGCRRKHMEVVMDGERLKMPTPLRYGIRHRAIELIVPRQLQPQEQEIALAELVSIPPSIDEVLARELPRQEGAVLWEGGSLTDMEKQ